MKTICILIFLLSLSSHSKEILLNEHALNKLSFLYDTDESLRSELLTLNEIFSSKNIKMAERKFSLKNYELQIMGHQLYQLSNGECKDQYFYWYRMLHSQQNVYLMKKDSYKKIRETILEKNEIPWDLLRELISRSGLKKAEITLQYENDKKYSFKISIKDKELCNGEAHRYVGLTISKFNNHIETKLHENFIEWKIKKNRTLKVDY